METWNSDKILDISRYYWQSSILHAAVKLDIFTVIGESAVSGKEIAKKINANEESVMRVANALSAMKLLHKKNDMFLNTKESKQYLNKSSESYIGFIILHHHYMMESWTKLDKAVITGKPVRDRKNFNDKKREAFLMGMYNLGMINAPDIVKQLDITGCKSLLDLGGGPGVYAIHFCLQNPGLKATVFDQPETRPFALQTIEKFGLTDRILFMEGDLEKDQFKGKYDLAWLSNIVHCSGEEACQKIIEKTVEVLLPGGLIMINDFILDNTKDSPLLATIFSINMLLGRGEAGKTYCVGELKQMLKSAGISDIKHHCFKGHENYGVIMGKKK